MESLSLIMKTVQAKISDDTQLQLKGIRSRINEIGEIADEPLISKLDTLIEAFMKML